MTIISYTGNVNAEMQEIETLKNAVDTAINNISNTFSELPSVWNDSKSAAFIATQQTLLSELKSANNRAKMSADEYVTDIHRILNSMYQN